MTTINRKQTIFFLDYSLMSPFVYHAMYSYIYLLLTNWAGSHDELSSHYFVLHEVEFLLEASKSRLKFVIVHYFAPYSNILSTAAEKRLNFKQAGRADIQKWPFLMHASQAKASRILKFCCCCCCRPWICSKSHSFKVLLCHRGSVVE